MNDLKDIKYNSYGEVKNINHYRKIEKLYNTDKISEEEKQVLSTKVKCYCGLLVSKAGIKGHITNSKIHRKRMSLFNISNDIWYANPHNAYARIQKTIEVTHDKFVIDFD